MNSNRNLSTEVGQLQQQVYATDGTEQGTEARTTLEETTGSATEPHQVTP